MLGRCRCQAKANPLAPFGVLFARGSLRHTAFAVVDGTMILKIVIMVVVMTVMAMVTGQGRLSTERVDHGWPRHHAK